MKNSRPRCCNNYLQASKYGSFLAVAVGFEPTVVLPTHAFEACSFGRSDTPPRRRLQDSATAPRREELVEQSRALGLADATEPLRAVVEPPVTDDVPERADRTGLRIP